MGREIIRFDTGISMAEYSSGSSALPSQGRSPQSLLPGSTTVSQALDTIFPEGQSIVGEIMSALVAGNSASMRTPQGFREAALRALRKLREKGTPAASAAVVELENLMADTEVFEQYRAALLET